MRERTAIYAGRTMAIATSEVVRPGDRPATLRQRARRPRRRRGRRLLALASIVAIGLGVGWLALRGVQAKEELEEARGGVVQVREALIEGDQVRARSELSAVRRHTAQARHLTSDPVWWLAGSLPWAGDPARAVATVSRAVDDLARLGLPPLIDAAGALHPTRLRLSGARVALQPLQRARPALERAAAEADVAHRRVEALEAGWLPGPIGEAVEDVGDELAALAAATANGARATRLVPWMLGAEGTRRYFVAFQTNAEARGTGGLIGAFAIVEARDGRIEIERLGSNKELETYREPVLELGEDYDRLYYDGSGLWADTNWSPHFPYTARQWLAMWERQTGQRLDGVLATDPVALSYVLEATGPVMLPTGERVTADNAVELTMKTVYHRFPLPEDDPARDAFFRAVSRAVFDRVLSGAGNPRALAEQLGRAAAERRVLVWSRSSAEQRDLSATPLAGLLPERPEPFAALVVNNEGGNKLDYYLRRRFDYRQVGCADDHRHTRVTVALTNTAPRRGLPPYVTERVDGDGASYQPRRGERGTYGLAVFVYAAQGARLTRSTLDGEPLSIHPGIDRSHPAFRYRPELSPGETSTAIFEFTEPVHPGPATTLVQPLARPQTTTMDIGSCD